MDLTAARHARETGSTHYVAGAFGVVDAWVIRQLRQMAGQCKRLTVAPTRALLTPSVGLATLRYQLSQLRCVDAVFQSSQLFEKNQIVRFPEQPGCRFVSRVTDNDFRPVTPDIDELTTDRPQPLVLLTGCFDLIHAGHMRLIEIASQLGTRPLVAALTTKGIRAQPKNVAGDRPFWSMADRLTVLSELKSNPRVMFFDGPDCLQLIERLKPDVFVKEHRDRSRKIVQQEARLVEQLGGRVMWVQDDRFGHLSSTAIAKAVISSSDALSEVKHGC